jgi:hypothetical protein
MESVISPKNPIHYQFYETTRTGFRNSSGILEWNSDFLKDIQWKTFWPKNTVSPRIISGKYPLTILEYSSFTEPVILGYPSRKENEDAILWLCEWYSRRRVEHTISDFAETLKGTLLILYKETLVDKVSKVETEETGELMRNTRTRVRSRNRVIASAIKDPKSHAEIKTETRTHTDDNTDAKVETETDAGVSSNYEETTTVSDVPKKRRTRTIRANSKSQTIPITEEQIAAAKEESENLLKAMYPTSSLTSECLLGKSHRLLYTGIDLNSKELFELPEEITEDKAEELGIPLNVPPPKSLIFARNRVRYILNEIIADPVISVSAESGILQEAIILANHQGIPTQWNNEFFRKCYEVLFQKVYKNLGSLGNHRLLERIRTGEVNSKHLAGMLPMDLWPEKWMEIENERIKKQIAGFEITAEGATDMFQCPRCHQRKCKYHEVQTRSADEPMTAFILCINCGKRWRE